MTTRHLCVLLAGLTLAVSAARGDASEAENADVLYTGGAIHTIESPPQCDASQRALATKGDSILWVGCLDRLPGLVGPATRRIDLGGRALLPGFVDAHSHMFGDTVDLADFEAHQALVLRNGITSQGELFVNQTQLDRLTSFDQADAFAVRTSVYLRWNNACGTVLDEWWSAYQPIHDPRLRLRRPGLKIFSDGGACNGAALSFPYPDGSHGDLYLVAEQLAPMIRKARSLGWQVAIHSFGDASRDEVLEAVRRCHRAPGPAVRVEHDAIIRPDQVKRYGRVGALPVVFGAVHTCTERSADPSVSWRGILGPSRYAWYRPLRDLRLRNPGLTIAWSLDLNGTVEEGADRPMHEGEAIASLYGLVTRRAVDTDGNICEPPADMLAQTITVEQALRMMTIGAATALGTESVVGSLKRGKLADFVIVSADPFAVDPAALKDLAVSATVVGGQPLYCAAGNEDVCAGATAASQE